MANLGLHPQSVPADRIVINTGWWDSGETVHRMRRYAPVRCACALPPMRAQARSCRVDRARTKRRRFVQRLRRAKR